ncbi:hypothetical protein HJA87_07180 [Rhizobium bangladeshense]|uniref:Uncharacterized protein n=2 Tax=Rhizobium bangladeshense TaxID=1138189 RepID=A0ABS7LED8_9HYPH|nr:hypothetical protein [Rhizobium bangladeshense]MBX4865777.1 hypothetical protein [Rhizobium bangladeshense]MBX4872335.1 hypothetical protein [Rhizobium bangladeshense]MBX4882358.1 hypothetical protein [Rhizobium bangladeshense]MBY3589668.1 hypothetical protein [Rhizobium bangladeshense]
MQQTWRDFLKLVHLAASRETMIFKQRTNADCDEPVYVQGGNAGAGYDPQYRRGSNSLPRMERFEEAVQICERNLFCALRGQLSDQTQAVSEARMITCRRMHRSELIPATR